MEKIKGYLMPVIVYFAVAGAITYMMGQFDLVQLLLSGILFMAFFNFFGKYMKKKTEKTKVHKEKVDVAPKKKRKKKKKRK